jgi:hypothetical protein
MFSSEEFDESLCNPSRTLAVTVTFVGVSLLNISYELHSLFDSWKMDDDTASRSTSPLIIIDWQNKSSKIE